MSTSDAVALPPEQAPAGDAAAQQQSTPLAPLAALCLIARLHHVPADPAHLAHQLGWGPNHPVTTTDLLLAAKHLGLKAKRSRTDVERLSLAPLPALAVMNDGTVVVLAQSDGQRVLF